MPSRRARLLAVGLAVALAGWAVARTRGPRLIASKAPYARAAPAKIRPPAAEVVAFLKASDPAVEVGPVTYSKHVAAILQAKCQACHRTGQVAPFALSTYDQARRWKAGIKEVVLERRMPPWHADPRHGAFANDRGLTAAQRAALVAWVDQGARLGDPAQVPEPRTFPDGWTIGEPDAVFTMLAPFDVPAEGVLSYQKFRVPTNFSRDVWVQALEARPGDRRVVHHICGVPRELGEQFQEVCAQ